MSVARFHICHFAVIKDFIYSARAERYYFYFLYEVVGTGTRVNGGEKWRQFQLIISPSDILMHYCYNYSKMSSKDHHTSFFLSSFFIEWKFNKQPPWLVLISDGAISFHLESLCGKLGYFTLWNIRYAKWQGPPIISLHSYCPWFVFCPLISALLKFCIYRKVL